MLRPKLKRGRVARAPTAADRNPLMAYVNAFLDWSAATGCSAGTLRTRGYSLQRFVAWCDERGLSHPREVTLPVLERYQRQLFHHRKSDGAPLCFGTQISMLAPIKAFFRWAVRERHILYNPASELVLPRAMRQLPQALLSVADIEVIINQPDIATPAGLRDRAILETLYSTGLRRMELVHLSLYDIDTRQHRVLVRKGKGGKDRVVPLGVRAAAWIDRYRDEVRPRLLAGVDAGRCFLTDYGEPFNHNRLGELVRRYIERAGFTVSGACHLFRHAMATHMLENGADVRYIQAMLGHADLATTAIYTQVSIGTLQAVHAATHPAKATRAAADLLSSLAAEAGDDEDGGDEGED